MEHIKSESNIRPNLINVDFTIVDVNLNITETTREEETIYEYDTYRFERNELTEKETYKIKIEALIRTKYSVNDEMAIIRQKDSKPQEYNEYNEYIEWCKEQAKL